MKWLYNMAVMSIFAIAAFVFVSFQPGPNVNYRKSVVYIEEGRAHASGVYLGGGRLLTANHVIAMGILPALKVEGATAASPLWNSPNTELGMFTVDGLNVPTADLDCGSPDLKVGDLVESVGNPFDVRNVHTFGRVATDVVQSYSYDDGLPALTVQFVNMAIMPGMSGGGVFHDGKLVGINSAAFGQNSLGVIIPKSVICSEISKWHPAFDYNSISPIGG